MLDTWQHSFSDDYSLTAAIEHSRRQIVFLPECLTPSYAQTDFPGLLEFSGRQVRITRVYRPQMWAMAFATHFLYCLTMVIGLIVALNLTLASRPAFQVLTLWILPLVLAAMRGALRVIGVTEALPTLRSQIMTQSWIYVLLAMFVPFLYLVNFCSSSIGRRIRWRGIDYELISPEQTRVLTR